MTPAEGVETFARILTYNAGNHVIVSTSDLQARLQRWVYTHSQVTPAEPPAPAVHQERPDLATDYIAPGTEIEEQIAAIWQELLGIKRIGVQDNFFDLGGDSLLGIQVVTRLRQSLGVNLSVQDLFEAPAVADLAEVLQTARLATQTLPAAAETNTGEREEIEL